MSESKSDIGARIDRLSIITGHAVSWLTLAMVLITFVIVVLRYIFDIGLIWLQETLTWFHAVVFMLGAAYTLQQEEHVRVDIFYRNMSEQRRAWVNLLGVGFFVFPMCAFFVWTSWGYVISSWTIGEVSRNAGGLPYPLLPLLKSLLLLMPVAVALQGISLLLKSLIVIRGD
jgi:TRAP-type mannitol/chloroaromatic compound transport system permease small subunit